ncbi:lamin tail domain-containing protein [Bernardetia sp. ABR2-2B]|uniref:lamin tail domain-containing protein n=1 Tax=Bernardetia sp. ABR2-2B TaxID=3127472 RepID=UPI0030CB51BA
MQLALLKKLTLVLFLFVGISSQAYAQIPFTENFNAFRGAGFAPTPAAGQLDSDVWKVTGLSSAPNEIAFGDTSPTSGDFARGASTGTEGTGGIYSFDIDTPNENYTLGVQPGGSDFTPGTFVARVQNNTGAVLTSVDVSYDVYYNNDQARANSFNFSYSSDDVAYTDVTALDFISPAGSDGLGWQTVARTTTITGLSIANGDYLYIRWTGDDETGSGSRDEFALDNVSVTSSTPSTLFFSEYIEGSSSNKALELYNPTGASVDLTDYRIELYTNGNTTIQNSLDLTGTLAAGATYVIANAGADAAVTGAADITSNITFFNGDDVLLLKESGTVIDAIGQLGVDPGSGWTVGTGATNEFTLRRDCAVTFGDTDETDAYTPIDWVVFPRDTFDGLGEHCPTAPTATITITGTPLTAFTTTALNVPSAEQSYQVSGTSLTTDITVTAPANFEVSRTTAAGFAGSVTIPFADANAGNVDIFVRYNPTAGTSHSGDITNASTGATTQNVAVTGSVPPSLITIAVARTRPDGEIVVIEGVLTAADQFGGPAFIQDATGGIAVFDNGSGLHDGTYPIGQSLRIQATRSSFQNQIQLGNVTSVTDLGAGTPVTPQVITLDQLDAHRGELITISNADFPQPGDLLFGNSNYTVTNGANSGAVRIDVDTDLAGDVNYTQPTTCDVTGVVGYFQTAPQLLPRFRTDLPCATPYVSSTASTFTSCISGAKTLEVSAFNIEWFGDSGNSPASSDAEQKDSVKVIIKANNADIYTLVEIVDIPLMQQLANELTAETADTWDILFSDFVSNPPLNGTQQRVGFLYKSNVIDPIFSYAMLQSIHPSYNGGDDSALTGYPADRDRLWASGRLPFWMRANVTLNGSSEEVDFIVIHGRANSSSDAQGRYDMRRYDVTVLEDSIRNNSMLIGKKIILAGDYNDDVDVTVADIPSTLTSFDAFTTRPTDYTIVSEALSLAGRRSYVFRENMIDHITASNELASGYIPNSVSVGYEFYDGDYTSTVSDHFLVSARFEIVPIASCNFVATANSSSQITLDWTDSTNIENSYVVEMSLDGTTGWTAITGSPFATNSINAVVTGLNASTQYFFRVRAEESASNFSEWVFANATTLALPPTPPTVVTLSPVDDATNVAITTDLVVTFDRNIQAGTGNITVTDGTTPLTFPIAGNADATVTISNDELSIDLTANLLNNTSYDVLIDAGAVEEAGTGADFAGLVAGNWNFTTVATTTGGGGGTTSVGTPTNFDAIAISTSQINLTWTAVTGAAGYVLYRDNVVVATLGNVASFEDTGLNADTFYSYKLVATNGNVQSDPIQTNARTFPTAPSVISVINACAGSTGIMNVSSTGVVYRIYSDSISTTPLFEIDNNEIVTPVLTQTTTFYVSVLSNGLESERTAIEVVVNALPTANILEESIFSCAATATLTAEEVTGATYTWLLNGTSLETTTASSFEVTRSGNYQVRVTLNGCSTTSGFTSVRLNFVPLAEINQGTLVRACNDSVLLTAKDAGTDATYEWVSNNVVLGNTASVSVSESGNYTLRVTQNGCTATDEITVEITTFNSNVTVLASKTDFCPTEEVTLSVENPETDVTYTWMRNGRSVNVMGAEYTTSNQGEYSVQVSKNNCTVRSSESVTIKRIALEPVYLRINDDVLSVESITPITNVVWFLDNEENTALEGQMSFTPDVTGYYSARVTFDTGCENTTRTAYYKVPDVVTGEEEIIDVETIVYPNPSNTGIFRVQLSSSIVSDVTFTVTDNIGRVLESKTIKANETSALQTIDLSQYAAGMYALTIDTEQGTVIKKIIIE